MSFWDIAAAYPGHVLAAICAICFAFGWAVEQLARGIRRRSMEERCTKTDAADAAISRA